MKTTNAKHAALPWRTGRKVARFVYASDETPICECEGMGEASREQEAANASFIVRAVNSHEELVTTLERIAARLESVLRWESREEAPDAVNRKIDSHPDILAARAAIHQAHS